MVSASVHEPSLPSVFSVVDFHLPVRSVTMAGRRFNQNRDDQENQRPNRMARMWNRFRNVGNDVHDHDQVAGNRYQNPNGDAAGADRIYDPDWARMLQDDPVPPPAPVQRPPPPRPPPPRDIQRKQDFYRQFLHLPAPCRYGDHAKNDQFDPFCLCRLEEVHGTALLAEERRSVGIPAGLINLGNTCYMNSYLQTLFHTLPIRRTLYGWNMPPPELQSPDKKYELARALRTLFAQLQTTQDRAVNPRNFVRSAGINQALQQDAQEFQILFLDWLDHVIADRPGEEKLQSLFKGRMRAVITCRSCRNQTSNEFDFYNLTLQVEGVKDVASSLERYFADEEFDGYNCERCAQPREASKTTRPTKLPRFLNLHLLRYYFNRVLMRMVKLRGSLDFPEILDLSSFLTEEQKREWGVDGCRFGLMAILIHVGGGGGGHYYARIRVATDGGRWYTFNDERVTPYSKDESTIDATDSYLLVYERLKDAERNAKLPVIPQLGAIVDPGPDTVWQAQQLKSRFGEGVASMNQLLIKLKVKPDSTILWLPTYWLANVARAIRGDRGPKGTILPPDMTGHLCLHGRLANFRQLKAVDVKVAETLFDALLVVPVPFFLDGSLFAPNAPKVPVASPTTNSSSREGKTICDRRIVTLILAFYCVAFLGGCIAINSFGMVN